jgi:hypothetical protein
VCPDDLHVAPSYWLARDNGGLVAAIFEDWVSVEGPL